MSHEVLWVALEALWDSQNKIEHHRCADIRIIHSKDAMLAEYALQCVLQPQDSMHWGYRLATIYAKRYDSRFGTRLVPASASAVEEIAAFWRSRVLGGSAPRRRTTAGNKAPRGAVCAELTRQQSRDPSPPFLFPSI